MRIALSSIALLMSTVSQPVLASDCSDAVDQYNSALSDVSYTLRQYSNCVSSSQGQDDCSSEFLRLKFAQDDFESAVGDISSYCG